MQEHSTRLRWLRVVNGVSEMRDEWIERNQEKEEKWESIDGSFEYILQHEGTGGEDRCELRSGGGISLKCNVLD